MDGSNPGDRRADPPDGSNATDTTPDEPSALVPMPWYRTIDWFKAAAIATIVGTVVAILNLFLNSCQPSQSTGGKPPAVATTTSEQPTTASNSTTTTSSLSTTNTNEETTTSSLPETVYSGGTELTRQGVTVRIDLLENVECTESRGVCGVVHLTVKNSSQQKISLGDMWGTGAFGAGFSSKDRVIVRDASGRQFSKMIDNHSGNHVKADCLHSWNQNVPMGGSYEGLVEIPSGNEAPITACYDEPFARKPGLVKVTLLDGGVSYSLQATTT